MSLNPFKRRKTHSHEDSARVPINPFEKSDAFIVHWKSLPKQSLLPRLQDFLDRPEPEIQPDIAIVDILPTGDLSVRLYGTGRVKTFNKNFTGSSNPLEAYRGEIGESAKRIMEQAVMQPCGFRAVVMFESSLPKRRLRTVSTLMPLNSEKENVQSFLHHQYLIDAVETDEHPTVVIEFTDGSFIDIGGGVPG